MRLFIGATCSSPLTDLIRAFQKRLLGQPLRLIKPENLHLTLVPPWDADDASLASDRLRILASALPLGSCRFDRWQMNGGRRDGMIWLQGTADPALQSLKSMLMAAFPQSNDSHPFVPHVTIARFHQQDRASLPLIDEPAAIEEPITNVTLFESLLSENGAEYIPRYVLTLSRSA